MPSRVQDRLAAAIIRLAAVGELAGLGHELKRFSLEELAFHQGEVPLEQVAGRCVNPPGRVNPALGLGRRRFGSAQGKRGVPRGLVLRVRFRREHGMLHAQRLEDALGQECAERCAGHFLDHPTQDDVTGIAVRESRRRLEVQLAAGILLDQLVRVDGPGQAAIHEVERVIVRVTRHVRHEVVERDVAGAGQAREILGHLVAGGELTLLGQEEDAGTGELLGDGTGGEQRVGADLGAGLQGGLAIAPDQDDLAVAHDGHGQADEALGLHLAGKVFINGLDIE